MTERRSWVRTIGCYLALWISLASALSGCTTSDGQPLIGANTADKSFWNFNVWGTERAFTAGIESIKTDLMAAAPGTFELKIHYRDALGHRKQNPESIKNGVFEAGQICVGYYPQKFTLLSVMELPFLLPISMEQRAKVEMAVMNHPDIRAELADLWNMEFLGPSFVPAYEFMGNKRIETVADMKGVTVRISGRNAKVLQVFGAIPVRVFAPDGYKALERGTIDNFGFPYSYGFGVFKLYEVSKYVTEGLAMSGFFCFQGVNRDAWNKAPAAVRKEMPVAQQKARDAIVSAYRAADEKWIPIFRNNLEVVRISRETRGKLAAVADKIWKKWADAQDAAGRPGSNMLKFVREQVAKASM